MGIIRTKAQATGGVTEAERVKLDQVAQEWTRIAYRTDPIIPEKIIPAIEGLYAAAGLKKPRVVIATSPLVMAFAYGAAAWVWHSRKNATYNATDNATADATDSATDSATDNATYNATYNATADATRNATDNATADATADATRNATDNATADATADATYNATADATRNATDNATDNATADATYNATRNATYNATADATRNATDNATYNATADATYNATDNATDSAATGATSACRAMSGKGGLACAARWRNAYQGGNMWAAWASYLAGFRDVIGLDLPEHASYAFWEEAAREGGFRVMHEEFCIVSDFPEYIRINNENRPHCENGPSHRWRDGWELFHWHGVAIPGEWVSGQKPSAREALTWSNIEQRRAACEIVGWANILAELDAKVIDKDEDDEIGTLLEVEIPDSGKERFLQVRCGTGRTFALPVPPEMRTALEANSWTYGLDKLDFKPEVRT